MEWIGKALGTFAVMAGTAAMFWFMKDVTTNAVAYGFIAFVAMMGVARIWAISRKSKSANAEDEGEED